MRSSSNGREKNSFETIKEELLTYYDRTQLREEVIAKLEQLSQQSESIDPKELVQIVEVLKKTQPQQFDAEG